MRQCNDPSSHSAVVEEGTGIGAGAGAGSFEQCILFCFLVGGSFMPAGIVSTIALLAIIALLIADPYRRPSVRIIPGAILFFMMLLAGLIGVSGNNPYNVAKDVWYVGNSATILLFGYFLMERIGSLQPVLRVFAISASVAATVHIFRLALHPSSLQSFLDIRTEVSAGYYITALGLGIAYTAARYKLYLFNSGYALWGTALLCLASVTLSFSRTLWVAVMVVGFTALFVAGLRNVMRWAILLGCMALITAATSDIDVEGSAPEEAITTFRGKIINSLQELKVADYTTFEEVNMNWRGFESYCALQSYLSGSTLERIVGKGFGTDIDIGFTMTLNDEEFDFIPILHNGYLYLLVKTGLIGLASFLSFLFLSICKGIKVLRVPDQEAQACGFLLIVSTLIILETTFVISGMFSKGGLSQTIILMGMLLGHAESILQKESERLGEVADLSRCSTQPTIVT
ncbi:MAG: hypothetical protein A2X58_13295 [Nitrospirae bacterium GWC2_56_14]|nr:MAG: hypothetical protein A2X58_13295 [Nitrospirae bacterium GWC2_56_14]